ncbi:hypothetical protein [Streptomyces purpureus]|uniref:Uncharacterized protein n=1 Tax=Streptomyces purpureus TaxID=1951 RepID=A0A918LTG2_9ACTN|nr:hypothetical protein [Streptomyces purpureus]GGT50572.1 hypothetical protein GCM10014713_50770 [Streptomyces purpureus]
MDVQNFERINAFVEDRLRPLFDAETGSEHGFGMDDTSRALRALLNTVKAAAAVRGLAEQREAAEPALREAIDHALAHNWDVLRGVARNWEDHPDFRREFKLHAWELDGATA